MHGCYPWSSPHTPHLHLNHSDAWWEHMTGQVAAALTRAGLATDHALRAAGRVRERFTDHSRAWRLFDDTLPALERARAAGWSSAILSNHVPELADMVHGLGLDPHLSAIFTSATSGYEKPHAEAFRLALSACGQPQEVWMVGDNPIADVQGAEALGLPAVLVRTRAPARRAAAGLEEALDLILAGSARL